MVASVKKVGIDLADKENIVPANNKKKDRPLVSFIEATGRTERRKLSQLSNAIDAIAGSETKDKGNLLVKWLKRSETKPLKEFFESNCWDEECIATLLGCDSYSILTQDNAAKLIQMLRPYSSCKAPILKILTENIPTKQAVNILNIPECTINTAKFISEVEYKKILLFVKQKSRKRESFTNREIDQFREYVYLKNPTPSGFKSDNCVQSIPTSELYEKFVQWGKELNERRGQEYANAISQEIEAETNTISNIPCLLSLKTFSTLLKKFKVKKLRNITVGQIVQNAQQLNKI